MSTIAETYEDTGSRRLTGRRLALAGGVCGLLAAIVYSAFLVERLVGSHLDPFQSYVSELGATNQPAAVFFRAADVASAAGVLVMAAALRAALPRVRRAAVGCAALVVFSIATVLDVLHPMTCTPSDDLACRAAEMASLLAQLREPHALTSIASIGSAIIAAAALGTLLTEVPGGGRPGIVATGSGVVTAAMALAVLPLITIWQWVGLVERIQVLSMSAGFGALACFLLLAGPRSCRTPGTVTRPAAAGTGRS